MSAPFTKYGIDPGRTLYTKDKGRVRARFLRASMRPAHCPEPSFDEVRWSDDYTYVYVQKTSGLMACGFDALFPEQHAVAEDQNWAIFDNNNPAARSLLGAIEAVLTDSPYATGGTDRDTTDTA